MNARRFSSPAPRAGQRPGAPDRPCRTKAKAMTTGLQLSRRFYESLVAPIIARALPQLSYAAARLGDGSEVLGFDTEMSADHNYGPTVQIILDAADFAHADVLMAALD